MDRSRESMAIEVRDPVLQYKLLNLYEYEGIRSSRSKETAKNARMELDSIAHWIRDANVGSIRSDLEAFLGISLSMEDRIDTFIVKTERRRQNWFNKMISPLIFSESPDEKLLREEMAEVIDLAKRLNQQAPRPLADGTGSHPQLPQPSGLYNIALDDSDFIRFTDQETKLIDQLFGPRCRKSETVIAVTGKAGSGKTFLTKTIYNMNAVQHVFNRRAWVDVCEDFKARDFLVDILKQLSWESLDENLPDNELELRLYSLTKEKHCLIVVDDVRTPNDWDKLSIVLRCIDYPSRLILTTCDDEIAKSASEGRNPVMPRSLNNDESWTLFLKKAPRAEDSFTAPELIALKYKILMKCDGLPQAILTLGGLLSARNPSEWSSVIDQLSAKGLKELSRVYGHALSIEELVDWSKVVDPSARMNILDLIYEDLPPPMKFCFLYLGLFPRASYISVRRLFHHWLAEGLVIPFATEQMAPEDLVEEYLNQLIRRNMIEVAKVRLDGSPKTCLMPGSIWDVFHPKAMDLGLFYVHNNTVNPSAETVPFERRIQRLAEYAGIQNYPSLDYYTQYLRSYVCFNTRKRDLPSQEIGMLLTTIVNRRGFGLLILLDLEKVFKPMLPDILGKLFHLKYLGLRWTSLDSLPMSVGYLPYLETLDVKQTNIDTLPSSIWKAKKLKHLYLNEIHLDMSIKQPKSGPLTNIQTLKGLVIGCKSHVETCLDNLTGLRKLGLTYNSTLAEEIADWISKLTNLQSLKLRSSTPFGQPSTLKLRNMLTNCKLSDLYLLGKLQLPRPIIDADFFPLSLKVLTLSVSGLEEDPMPILGYLRDLNILRLFQDSYKGCDMICHQNRFPQLRVLKLRMLPNLMRWTVEKGAMPQLRELEIRKCCRLQVPKNLNLIQNLKEVTLMDMPPYFVNDLNRVMTTAIVRSFTQGDIA